MPLNVDRITLANATTYYANVGTAVPADTVGAGGAWPAGWTRLGFTSDATTFTYEYDVVEADVQESLSVVRRQKKSEKASLETTIAEMDLSQWMLATEGTRTGTTAASGIPGKDELGVGGSNLLSERAWGIEGFWTTSGGVVFPVRIFIWRATAMASLKLGFDKTKYLNTGLKVGAMTDFTQTGNQKLFKISQITAAALP